MPSLYILHAQGWLWRGSPFLVYVILEPRSGNGIQGL